MKERQRESEKGKEKLQLQLQLKSSANQMWWRKVQKSLPIPFVAFHFNTFHIAYKHCVYTLTISIWGNVQKSLLGFVIGRQTIFYCTFFFLLSKNTIQLCWGRMRNIDCIE